MQDPHTILVLATFFLGLGMTSLIAGWAEARLSKVGLGLSMASVGLFVWVHASVGLTASAVPEAFVEIVARIFR